MTMTDDYRLHEIFEGLQKYSDDDVFEKFKTEEFFRYGPAERVAVLAGYDRLMEHETKPSRATAELIDRKRQLDDLHFILKKAGR
jgi:hypothetical protein